MSLAENIAAIRRLAAILAADVAGYSRLMGTDEEGTLARLKAHRRELVDPKIREHRGRIVKTTGDGLLVEFASVVDAVRCAVEVQRAMLDREADVAGDKRIRFRIGINLGDIIADGDDIFGDGVNIAARLEALAEPGGVCVSRTVRNQVRDKLPYEFDDMGEQAVKNIARPVRTDVLSAAAIARTSIVPVQVQPASQRHPVPRQMFLAAGLILIVALGGVAAWWLWPSAAPQQQPSTSLAPPAASAPRAAPRLSIVVLPFANLSNDPEQEYFVDAITDDLTTDLSRIVDSFVIARTTAFTYKSKPIDVKQIGRDLGVRYVLEGSVRRLGEQVQVNVQLLDAETGAHIWADRFDIDRLNLTKAQRDIVARLARTLHLELLEAVGRQLEKERPVDPDVRDLTMRGWAWYYRPVTETNLREALQAFERALNIDPESVEARVGIARVLLEYLAVGWSKLRGDDIARVDRLLTETLERDRNHPKAHLALGHLRRIQGRFTDSQVELEKAIALDPNEAGAMLHLGWTVMALGNPEAVLLHLEKALQLNPKAQNVHYFHSALGLCHLMLGNAGEAVAFLRKANAANARTWWIPFYLAAALGLNGDIEEAKAALAESLKLKPDVNSFAAARKFNPYNNPQSSPAAERTIATGLRRAGFPEE